MFDADFHRWMRDAKRFGSPLIAEYGVEANGYWFPWNGRWNKGPARTRRPPRASARLTGASSGSRAKNER